MDPLVKLSIPITWAIQLLPKAKHRWWKKPKIKFDVGHQRVVFVGQDNKEKHLPYFYILIENISDRPLNINLNRIRINGELYQVIIQMENNFLSLNPKVEDHWKDCKNDIYKTYSNNWFDIAQNTFTYSLEPFNKKIFPMKLIGVGSSHNITRASKSESLLFFPKSKYILSVEINEETYEYGLDRAYVYGWYINYLASHIGMNKI